MSSKIDLVTASELVLQELSNMTDEELVLALEACEDNAVGYAVNGYANLCKQYVIEEYEYHRSKHDFIFTCEIMIALANTRNYPLYTGAANDEIYALAA